ncbi:hypothetical protein CMI37_20455 [Candidatus Pacearchaeota archaeon]|nr:hypothetical protein [Candidatus Pacearchaeota archaeon]
MAKSERMAWILVTVEGDDWHTDEDTGEPCKPDWDIARNEHVTPTLWVGSSSPWGSKHGVTMEFIEWEPTDAS